MSASSTVVLTTSSKAETGLGEDGADVLEALLGLALDVLGGEGAGGGVDGQLAGDEGEPAGGGDALE